VRRFAFFLTAAVLASWMAPNAVAVGIGLHLLLEEHHVAAHAAPDAGHDHDVVAAAAHSHELVPTRYTSTTRPLTTVTLATELTAPSIEHDSWRTRPQSISHSPPSTSLYLAHCSLLI
jgi:hypothetical protein